LKKPDPEAAPKIDESGSPDAAKAIAAVTMKTVMISETSFLLYVWFGLDSFDGEFLRRDGRRPVGHGGRRGRLAGQERSEHPTIGRENHMSTASAKSAPGPHEIANSEIEADEHHERDN
jgi:hypothetical protein